MKKLLLLLIVMLSLVSCTAEPLPENSLTYHSSMYAFDWESNQVEPYVILRTYYYDGVTVRSTDTITSKHFERELTRNQYFTVSINYKATSARPECYLSISKQRDMNLSSNTPYTPGYDLLYEKETNTNGFGYSGYVQKDGKLKDL